MDWAVNRYARGFVVTDYSIDAHTKYRINLTTGEKTLVSKHAAPVRHVRYSAEHGKKPPSWIALHSLPLTT